MSSLMFAIFNPYDAIEKYHLQTGDNKFRQILNKLPGIRLGQIRANVSPSDIDTLRQVIQESPRIEWKQFTPAPIEEPNCYVEVQVVSSDGFVTTIALLATN